MFRLKLIRSIIVGVFFILAITLFVEQVVKGNHYFALSETNSLRLIPREGRRGNILDRHGIILANSQLTFNVSLIKQDIQHEGKLFDFLSKMLGISVDKLRREFSQNLLTPFAPVVVARDVSREQAIVIAENMFRFPGLLIQESYQRVYPKNFIGAHVLGYVAKPNQERMKKLKEYGYTTQTPVGYTGIEEYYEDFLKGVEGGEQIEVDSRGRKVRLLSVKEPGSGEDVALSIDHRIQQYGTELLANHIGSIAVMDLDNGEILGLVNMPTFNPNDFVDKRKVKRRARYIYNKQAPLLNRALAGQYPPGSVFKIPVALASLHEDKITPHTTYYSPGFMEMGGQKFRSHVVGHQDLYQAIAKSDNVYFFHLGIALGAEHLARWAQYFGLGQQTNIDLPFEKLGRVPSKVSRRWYTGDTMNFSIGQGELLTTPMQLLNMMSLVANKGYFVQPHVIHKIGYQNVQRYDQERFYALPKKISNEDWDAVHQGMRMVVEEYAGTAHALRIRGLNILGKTGTAQAGGNKEDHSWFVGYVDQNKAQHKQGKRRVAFCVFLEHGGSSYNAVLIARQLLLELKNLNYI